LHAQHVVVHWRSNLAIHTSARGLIDALHRGSFRWNDRYVYAYGQTDRPDESEMSYGFEMSAFRLGWLARLVLIESNRDLDDLERAYAGVKRAARDLRPSALRQLGRNDDCWCGSGQKYKNCHGTG